MKKALITLFVLLIATLTVTTMYKFKPTAKNKPIEKKDIIVETVKANKADVELIIESQGNVQARVQTALISEVSGTIIYVSPKFASGNVFSKGEALLKIDPTDYSVAVKQATALLAGQEAKLAQEQARTQQAKKDWQTLGKKSAASDLVLRKPFLAEAEANVKSAESDLERAKVKLDRTIIRAPYDGMVKEKVADIGQFVSVGSTLGTIFTTDTVEVRLPITDTDISFLEVEPLSEQTNQTPSNIEMQVTFGKKVEIWKGRLTRVEGTIDPQSRVHYVIAEIDDPYLIKQNADRYQQALKIGSFVKAKIKAKTLNNVIVVPRPLIQENQSIFIVNANNQLERRDINVIRTDTQFAYVSFGINQDDKILSTRLNAPVAGMQVQPLDTLDTEKVVKKERPSAPKPL